MNAMIRQSSELVSADRADAIRTALKSSLYPGAADESVDLVLSYCKAAGLDPMQKPVHIVPMWDGKNKVMRDVVMPGIGLYRTNAARTGEFAGISEPEFGPIVTERIGNRDVTFPEWCKVSVRRQLPSGHVAEFTAVEYWVENYAIKGGKEQDQSPNAMWSKRPRGQLAKCAQAQALRMAFPEAVGAAPTAEEMEGKAIGSDEHVVVQSAPAGRPERQPYPVADFEANLPKWRSVIAEGKRTADQIIAMVESKGSLTDAQREQIRTGRPPDAPIDGEFVETQAEGEAP